MQRLFFKPDAFQDMTMEIRAHRLLLVGYPGGTNVGASFQRAAKNLRIETWFCDAMRAYAAPRWVVRFNWWLRGRRPPYLSRFSNQVVKACWEFQPQWLISTGIAPLEARALKEIGQLGVERINYLTDDPWSQRIFRPRWFFEALPYYDRVFSPRRANLSDMTRSGCQDVQYLPFAFAPELCYPEIPATMEEKTWFSSEVVFVGGADRDRLAYISALIQAGFKVSLYGPYWERFSETRDYTQGQADVRTLRLAISGAKVALCLVRRVNRDGHCMRTFEIPAIGTCMLTEDTEEHREIFGHEGKLVVYFSGIEEMCQKLRWLLNHEEERKRLAAAAQALILGGGHTYQDRLSTMLKLTQ